MEVCLSFMLFIFNYAPGGTDEPDPASKVNAEVFSANLDFENG